MTKKHRKKRPGRWPREGDVVKGIDHLFHAVLRSNVDIWRYSVTYVWTTFCGIKEGVKPRVYHKQRRQKEGMQVTCIACLASR